MKIKKSLFVLTVFLLCLGLSSCSSFRSELFARDDKKTAETRFQEIIKALENHDNEELKKMFSPNALQEAYDIDGGIEYIMNFYQGKIKSKDGSRQGSDSINDGEKIGELECYYEVTTDKDKYIVFFVDKIVDTKNPDNVGLYML